MNNTMNSSLQKIPGIGDIPILGLLFKSKAAQKGQTELVVMITPEILPNGSVGVTPALPRLVEPFMPPAPKTLDTPPPASRWRRQPERRRRVAAPSATARRAGLRHRLRPRPRTPIAAPAQTPAMPRRAGSQAERGDEARK